MTFTLIALGVVALSVGVVSRVVFKDYPQSAIDWQRNVLFELRSELFELGKRNVVPFDNDGYRFAREMLNAMIRYAHDISAGQLIISAILRRDPASREYQRMFKAYAQRCVKQLPTAGRVEVERIMNRATVTMVQLVITRSLVLSGALGVVMIFYASSHLAKKAHKSINETLLGEPERRSQVEEAIEEVLENRQMQTVRPIIKAEASRYARPFMNGPFNGFPKLAQAA